MPLSRSSSNYSVVRTAQDVTLSDWVETAWDGLIHGVRPNQEMSSRELKTDGLGSAEDHGKLEEDRSVGNVARSNMHNAPACSPKLSFLSHLCFFFLGPSAVKW